MNLSEGHTNWWCGYFTALVDVAKYETGDVGESIAECIQYLILQSVKAIALEGYAAAKKSKEEGR